MDSNVTVALISGGFTALVGIVAITVNTFWLRDALNGIRTRLGIIESDIKEWSKIFNRIDTDVQRLKDKTGLGGQP